MLKSWVKPGWSEKRHLTQWNNQWTDTPSYCVDFRFGMVLTHCFCLLTLETTLIFNPAFSATFPTLYMITRTLRNFLNSIFFFHFRQKSQFVIKFFTMDIFVVTSSTPLYASLVSTRTPPEQPRAHNLVSLFTLNAPFAIWPQKTFLLIFPLTRPPLHECPDT